MLCAQQVMVTGQGPCRAGTELEGKCGAPQLLTEEVAPHFLQTELTSFWAAYCTLRISSA